MSTWLGRLRRLRRLRQLRRRQDGAVAVEFSLVLFPLLMLVLGAIEFGIVLFIGSTLESAVLEASRYGITGNEQSGFTREQRVRQIVADRTLGLLDMDKLDIDTLVYQSFGDIGQPEPFTDNNGNGVYDQGDTFTDINGNGVWDSDMGLAGLGGPGDVVVYRIGYEWGIITPFVQKAVTDSITHEASIAVRNEPF